MLIRYIIFAFISSFVNFLAQKATLWGISSFLENDKMELLIAQICGLGSGFVLKYFLDRAFVFNDKEIGSKAEETKKVSLYALMSVFTTFIFMGVQWCVFFMAGKERASDVGLVIGLLIGYTVKYFLDKRFVFKKLG